MRFGGSNTLSAPPAVYTCERWGRGTGNGKVETREGSRWRRTCDRIVDRTAGRDRTLPIALHGRECDDYCDFHLARSARTRRS